MTQRRTVLDLGVAGTRVRPSRDCAHRSTGSRSLLAWAFVAGQLVAASCAQPVPSGNSANPDVEWRHYGGAADGTKYSPLAQIDRKNVASLQVAWAVRTGDFPPVVFASSAERAVAPRRDRMLIQSSAAAQCKNCRGTHFRFETTPLMRDGMLYVSTPRNRVLALDPASGVVRWTFDPQVDLSQRYAEDLVSRGVPAWADTSDLARESCARRIFLATIDARLFALDAPTGMPCTDFGERGVVRLRAGIGVNGRDAESAQFTITSPPAVINDVVVVGSAVNSNYRREVASGVVRAYDARTGGLRWSFDPIPRAENHPAWKWWTPEAARMTGAANVWSIISTDAERDLVFLPTASAAPDFYGGKRPGRNDFANSVVAVRGSTGEVVWSYQVVHHDLWDYDVAAQPMLVTLQRNGYSIPAVVVGTKTGMVFVLNRETGIPLNRVEERPVPASDVPGEAAWPMQPFPVQPSPLHGVMLTPDSAFGISDEERNYCRRSIAQLRNEGIFTPPSLQGTLIWPGFWGGINWDGMAWDSERQLLITTVKRLAVVVQLHRRRDSDAVLSDLKPGQQYMAQEGTPYGATRMPLVSPSGIPCTPPPWGSLVALGLADGAVRWLQPLGTVPWLTEVPGSEKWGSIVFGGPLVTAGGLVFIGAAQDDRFRAFDVDSGELLWEHQLPAGGQAAPMTYRYNGTQYVVIAAGGRGGIGSPGDWIVAFALPEMKRRVSPAAP